MNGLDIIIGVIFVIVGICFASFSNVLIYRLPNHMSLIKPNSHCPNCDHELSWYENIPIFSYIFLKGKCKNCHKPISPRYLIVEILGGVFSLLAYLRFGLSVDGVVAAISLILLMAIGLIDFEHMEIPLSLSITLFSLAVIKLVGNIIVNPVYDYIPYLIGFGTFLAFFLLMYFIPVIFLKKEGFGIGDVILFSIAGLYLNWAGGFLVILFGSIICSIIMIILIKLKKISQEQPMGFGPYISLVFMIMIFFEKDFLSFITSLL